MRPPNDYDVYIFDCDGVILDSNNLKVAAMRAALLARDRFSTEQIEQCVDYFAKNFGKSRFFFIRYFIDEILKLEPSVADENYKILLETYSAACKELYLEANIAPGLIDYLQKIDGRKYVASGSAQDELRWVFERRGLQQYFQGVFGAPASKTEIVARLAEQSPGRRIVLIGDAVSDFRASQNSAIDFCYYSKFSLVNETMLELAAAHGFPVINEF